MCADLSKPRSDQAGFSLVEVLVAFLVLSLVLTAALSSFAAGLRSIAVAEQNALALRVAESVLAETGLETPLVTSRDSGDRDATYRWERRVRAASWWSSEAIESTGLQAWEVEVTVSWGEQGQQRRVSLATLRIQGEAR